MANRDLNSSKIFIALTIASLIIGIIVAIITNGFTVWDRLHSKPDKKPILSVRIEPLTISIDSQYYHKKISCYFDIETSDGAYKILKDFSIDSFKIEKPAFFYDTTTRPFIKFSEVVIDRLILDQRTPDLGGLLKFEDNFILDGKMAGALTIGEENEIATFLLYFPYEFMGHRFTEKIRIPVIIKRG